MKYEHYPLSNKLFCTFGLKLQKTSPALLLFLFHTFCLTLILAQLLVIYKQKSPDAAALSLVVGHLTGNKETRKLFHRSETGISCDGVPRQIKSFLTEVKNNVNLAPKIHETDNQLISL